MAKTIIDMSSRYPSPQSVKAAGHVGVMLYLSPARESWMGAKRITRAVVEGYRDAGLEVAFCWQYGAGNARESDVMRGRAGGVQDAQAAERKLKEVGCEGWPVFLCADFNITLNQWNDTAAHYFRGAIEVLGKQRVGIYGHSRVIAWAAEDDLVADLGLGKVLGWQTISWSGGVRSTRSVLLQRTHNVPGPDGVLVDVNDIQNEFWGQRPPGGTAPPPKVGGSDLIDPVMERYLKLEADENRIMNKHFAKGRGGARIEYVTRHHTAGILTLLQIWQVWQDRAASAHYLADPTGKIGQMVWDSDTAWSNGNSFSNARSITIEHSNSGGAPGWPISDATIIAGARWAAAICLHFKLGRPVFGKNIRDHKEFSSTSCPFHLANGGKYHQKWMDEAQTFYDRLVAYRDRTPINNESKEDLTMSQYEELKAQNDRIERKVDLLLDQMVGPGRNTENGLPDFTGWDQLGGRTLVDFLAESGNKAGVEGCLPAPEGTRVLGVEPDDKEGS